MTLTLTPTKLVEVGGHPGLYRDFKSSLGYLGRPHLRNKTKQNSQNRNKTKQNQDCLRAGDVAQLWHACPTHTKLWVQPRVYTDQVWWHRLVISALRRRRQEVIASRLSSVHSEFKASLHQMRPCAHNNNVVIVINNNNEQFLKQRW